MKHNYDLNTKEGFSRFKIEMLEEMIPGLKELKLKEIRLIEETIANGFYCGAYLQKNGTEVVAPMIVQQDGK